jgi:hypothetical protein
MKPFYLVVAIAGIACLEGESALAQGTFQNLDFEQASIVPLPGDNLGIFIVASDALPHWVVYGGSSPVGYVIYNTVSLGTPIVSLHDSASTIIQPLEGNYSAALQAGVPGPVTAAIAQTGLIPADALSLQLRGGPSSTSAQFAVTIGGLPITMIPLLNTATYTLYGGDISGFAGQTDELRIAALPVSLYFSLDAIEFSTQAVPEPSTIGILGLGALFLGWRWHDKAKR